MPIIENYSPLEYKGHRQNWWIAQAPDGRMFIANGKGVLSFDGEEWALTLVPNRGHVRSLDVSADGTVYVGANNDLGQLYIDSLGERQFSSFLPLIDSSDHEFGRVFRTIATPEGVYFQSNQRIFRYKEGKIKVWQFNGNSYRIFYIDDKLYVSDISRGLLVLENEEFQLATKGETFINARIRFMQAYKGRIIIGTQKGSLYKYDGLTLEIMQGEIARILSQQGIAEGRVFDQDKIAIIPFEKKGFLLFDNKENLEKIVDHTTGLPTNSVLTLFVDKQSSIWIGMQEGIARIDVDGPYSIFDERLNLEGTIQGVLAFEDNLFAASGSGLLKIQEENDQYLISDIGQINSYCWDLEYWNDQLILASSAGVYSYKNDQLIAITKTPTFSSAISFSDYDSSAVYIVVDDGFLYFQEKNGTWLDIGAIRNIRGAVRDILETERGVFWLKTRSNGLFRVTLPEAEGQFQFEEAKVDHFDNRQGVPGGENNIFKIENLFLVRSELDSVYKYDPVNERFTPSRDLENKFDLKSGRLLPKSNKNNEVFWFDYLDEGRRFLLSSQKNQEGVYTLKKYPFSALMEQFRDPYGNEVFNAIEDKVWFAGMLGILQADLNKLDLDYEPVTVIFNEIKAGEKTIFKEGKKLSEGTIPFTQNSLTFNFSSPYYANAEKLEYSVQLDGYESNWAGWSTLASKTYTNLPEGSYTFNIKARNDFGEISQVQSFSFTIRPPWYRSYLALFFYVILGGLLFWLALYLRSNNLRKEQIRLEKIVSQRTIEIQQQAEEINELYQVKNRFLANISHEFRTPLTLILGPAEQLYSNAPIGSDKKHLGWILKNSQKLLKLINQLLDLSKIEVGQLKLQSNQHDLVRFCKYMISAFDSMAAQKNIKLIFESKQDQIFVYFDQEKMEQVLNNLLYNALKFTNQGLIMVKTEEISKDNKPFAQISVIDTGIGIHSQQLPYIFERFYQAEQDEEVSFQGTGIGLALCKELVELHSGEIFAESELEKGTQFYIHLPLGREHLKDEEVVIGTETLQKPTPVMVNQEDASNPVREESNLPLILLIDDNEDILDYIQFQLTEQFRFLKASNGREGLEIARKELPDLILSDVMMPEMNGFELCYQIKNDMTTDHIPVVLLTARVGEDYKIQGLESKADEYIQKPFNNRELSIRLQNLIEGRRRLRKRFAEKLVFQASEIAGTPQEETFLEQLLEAIQNHLDDSQFDVNALSQLMNMSKSQLNRKMRAVINKSPNQFIRSYRLETARQMILRNKDLTLSEIAYDTGFSSPAYFSKCFHDEFGYPPSKLIEK